MEKTLTKVDFLLTHISTSKKRFYKKYNTVPNCVTLNRMDVERLKERYESMSAASFEGQKQTVFGLEILSSYDIEEGYISLGVKE